MASHDQTSNGSANGAGTNKNVVVKSPSSLAHIVFRTANLKSMLEYWTKFLGASITHANDNIAFLRYDDEHHRVAIIAIPETQAKPAGAAGLHHVAFTFDTMEDLVTAYKQRKELGMLPVWSVNHGPTTSMYYNDPDGNMIETQVDNFDTVKGADDFMKSNLFAENPIGTDFDPEDLVRKLEAGENVADLKKRVEIGPRGLPNLA